MVRALEYRGTMVFRLAGFIPRLEVGAKLYSCLEEFQVGIGPGPRGGGQRVDILHIVETTSWL